MSQLSRPQGVHQKPCRIRRYTISLAAQLVGATPETGLIQFTFPSKAFRFLLSSGVAAGQVLIALGRPADQGGGTVANGFSVAGLADVFDPFAVPSLRLLDGAVTDVSVYSSAALAGQTLTIFAFEDAELFPGSFTVTGTVALSGTSDVNVKQFAASADPQTLAVLPTLRTVPFGRGGMTVASADADHFNAACGAGATTLVRAGQTDGYLFDGLSGESGAPAPSFLRRNSTNAAQGMYIAARDNPATNSIIPVRTVYAGGTDLYCQSAAGINIKGFLYRGFA